MKHLLLATVVFFIGCRDNTVTLSKEEYNKLVKKDTVKPLYPKSIKIGDRFDWEIILGSDGHEYCNNDGGNAYVCFHYVDCIKCKNKKDSL